MRIIMSGTEVLDCSRLRNYLDHSHFDAHKWSGSKAAAESDGFLEWLAVVVNFLGRRDGVTRLVETSGLFLLLRMVCLVQTKQNNFKRDKNKQVEFVLFTGEQKASDMLW